MFLALRSNGHCFSHRVHFDVVDKFVVDILFARRSVRVFVMTGSRQDGQNRDDRSH